MTIKVLKRHTDRFSLYKNARKGRQNGRNYLLSAVKSMFESAETQEGLRLGELYGYYGHGRREMFGLDVSETAVMMVEGRPVVVDNVPGCRTVELTIDDDGVVTHTQEIFDNEPGRIIAGLLESRAGGWSWATSGRNGTVAIPTRYFGMDYVKNPNFVSLDHPAYMNESAEQESKLLESLQEKGYSEAGARDVINHFNKIGEQEMTHLNLIRVEESEIALLEARGQLIEIGEQLEAERTRATTADGMLESAKAEHAKEIQDLNSVIEGHRSAESARNEFLESLLESLPVFVTETQREAFASLSSEDDMRIVKGLFESIRKTALGSLPIDRSKPPVEKTASAAEMPMISFHETKYEF